MITAIFSLLRLVHDGESILHIVTVFEEQHNELVLKVVRYALCDQV
jgi:hypothetical protein